jgi:hypothetical protein
MFACRETNILPTGKPGAYRIRRSRVCFENQSWWGEAPSGLRSAAKGLDSSVPIASLGRKIADPLWPTTCHRPTRPHSGTRRPSAFAKPTARQAVLESGRQGLRVEPRLGAGFGLAKPAIDPRLSLRRHVGLFGSLALPGIRGFLSNFLLRQWPGHQTIRKCLMSVKKTAR